MLTKEEAHAFLDDWFESNSEKITEFIKETMSDVTESTSVGQIVGKAVAVGMRVSANAAIAVMDENNRRWEVRLREAGISLA